MKELIATGVTILRVKVKGASIKGKERKGPSMHSSNSTSTFLLDSSDDTQMTTSVTLSFMFIVYKLWIHSFPSRYLDKHGTGGQDQTRDEPKRRHTERQSGTRRSTATAASASTRAARRCRQRGRTRARRRRQAAVVVGERGEPDSGRAISEDAGDR